MRIERIELTPNMAEYFLSRNYDEQRRINYNWVETISNDIREGRWNPNIPNSAIVFSKRGDMLDGQHRCLAVVKANMPVRTYAIYDVDESSFGDIDNGISRTARDFMKCKNSNTVASIATTAVCIEEGALIRDAIRGVIKQTHNGNVKVDLRPSREQILSYYNHNHEYLEQVASYASSIYTSTKTGGKAAYARALLFIDYVEGDSSMAQLFFEDVKAGMQTTQATSQLVKKLMQMDIDRKVKRVRVTHDEQIATILAAYEKFKSGKSFTRADVRKALDLWNSKIAITRMNKGKAETEVPHE